MLGKSSRNQKKTTLNCDGGATADMREGSPLSLPLLRPFSLDFCIKFHSLHAHAFLGIDPQGSRYTWCVF